MPPKIRNSYPAKRKLEIIKYAEDDVNWEAARIYSVGESSQVLEIGIKLKLYWKQCLHQSVPEERGQHFGLNLKISLKGW